MIIKFILPLLLFVIASCKNEREIKPVEILYGQETCEKCQMIISEKAYSAQYILHGGKAEKFDDIGCMIHLAADVESKGDKILARYVRDYNTGEWIDAEKAYFVWSKDIMTPMGHGLAAFGDQESAQRLARKVDGTAFSDLDEASKWVLKSEGREE